MMMPMVIRRGRHPIVRPRGFRRSKFLLAFLVSLTASCTSALRDIPPTRTAAPSSVSEAENTRPATAAVESSRTPSLIKDTETPTEEPTLTPSGEYYEYHAQSGDTLNTLAVRFNVSKDEIREIGGKTISERGFLSPGLVFLIPKRLDNTSESTHLFPDGEIVFSKSSGSFSTKYFVREKEGYLLEYKNEKGMNGIQIISEMAANNSINPKILLALLEHTSGWVTQAEPSKESLEYPLKFTDPNNRSLDGQLRYAINFLEKGYYAWRKADILTLTFYNGEKLRLAPDLNAGTVAVMYYFSKMTYSPDQWGREIKKFLSQYEAFFGNPGADAPEPLFPDELDQPFLILPFHIGQSWCVSSGPHGAWDPSGPEAAVDFSPVDKENADAWSREVLASASGCVVRSENNAVVLDLDCDGLEQTGWNLQYFHIAEEGQVGSRVRVERGDRIGYASSEGGSSTGIHVHVARKFNGEWMLAGGPIPFSLSGWILSAGYAAGEWMYTRGGRAVIASHNCFRPNIIDR